IDGGVFGGVTVFDPLLGLGPRSGAEIGADIGLGTGHFDIVEELVGTEPVALDRAPCHLKARGPRVARADAVGPVIVRREVSPGPAQEGDIHFARRIEYIAAEA